MSRSLDLNADVGEGFPFDRALLDVVSSANVACGFHAGDPGTMRELCRWCRETGVAVGAQVSYRDREGFGRRVMEIGYDDLRADVVEQLDALQQAAQEESVSIRYVKPHGALYNRIVADADLAALWCGPSEMDNKKQREKAMRMKTRTWRSAIEEAGAAMTKPLNMRMDVNDRDLKRSVKTAFDLARSEGRRLHLVFSYKAPLRAGAEQQTC